MTMFIFFVTFIVLYLVWAFKERLAQYIDQAKVEYTEKREKARYYRRRSYLVADFIAAMETKNQDRAFYALFDLILFCATAQETIAQEQLYFDKFGADDRVLGLCRRWK